MNAIHARSQLRYWPTWVNHDVTPVSQSQSTANANPADYLGTTASWLSMV